MTILVKSICNGVDGGGVGRRGSNLIYILSILINSYIVNEHIPICFVGVFKYLFLKGNHLQPGPQKLLMNQPPLTFQQIVWNSIVIQAGGGIDNCIILGCQGASKKKHLCICSAFILQEAVAASRESNNTFFVVYFNVVKAFDSV